MILQKEFLLKRRTRGFHLITEEVLPHLPALPETGLLNWFVKHTMIAYAMLGGALLIILCDSLVWGGKCRREEWKVADNLVCAGSAFLTLGMLCGALWAKEAWGPYWGGTRRKLGQLLPGSVMFFCRFVGMELIFCLQLFMACTYTAVDKKF